MPAESEAREWGPLLYDDSSFVDRASELRSYRKEWLKVTVTLLVVVLGGGTYLAWGWSVTGDARVLIPLILLGTVGSLVAVYASMRAIPLTMRRERVLRVYERGLFLPWYTLLDLRRGQFVDFRSILLVELNEAPYRRFVKVQLRGGGKRLLWKDDIGSPPAFEASLIGRVEISKGRFRAHPTN